MKNFKTISSGSNYSALDIGGLHEIGQYGMLHPKSGIEVKGKVFLKEATGATGTEISFNTLSAHTELPYFHSHRKNEETYIVLSGSGNFQVDDDCFPIREGSVIRIAPQGIRGMLNSSDEEMNYIVIQSREDSLEEYSSDDGQRIDHQAKRE